MKIKLAILESDKSYLDHIVASFNRSYSEKFEIYSFTCETSALNTLVDSKIDVFLASDNFEIQMSKVPPKCSFAYLVDSKDIETFNDQPVICKFQKAELIYKEILSMFAEKTSAVTGSLSEGQEHKVVAFISASGGTGSTVAAAAYAVNMARRGKKVVYLNMEMLGDPDAFFHGEGNGNFGDIIYAIKSKKSNLALKLESTVKRDESGVYYFSPTQHALDMMELKTEEMSQIIKELKTVCKYDYIVIDIDFRFDKQIVELLKECSNIILVSDGSVTSNSKIKRMLDALNIIENDSDNKLGYRMSILYNRFSSKTSTMIEDPGINVLGGIKRFEGYTVEQLIRQIAEMALFDALV